MDATPRQEADGAPRRRAAPASSRPEPTSTAAPVVPQDEVPGSDGDGEAQSARRLTRRRAAAAALLAIACAVAAIVVLASGGANRGAPAKGVPPGYATATLTRRTLTESASVDGTLGYGTTTELYDRLSGTFTWLPSVGSTIDRGGTLFRIDDLPVVLMYGSVPAYRNLKEGVSDGSDVIQLNDNLVALGYDPYGAIGERNHFGAATAEAVRRWQKAEGLSQTGSVELGRVIFAPSARRVTALKVALGQDPPGASTTPASTAPASTTPASTTPASTTPSTTSPSTTPASEPHGPEHESSKEPSKPHSKRPSKEPSKKPSKKPSKEAASPADEPSSQPGQKPASKGSEADGLEPTSQKGNEGGAGAGEPVLTTTSTQQLVALKLKAEQQQLAHVGERAPVTLPGGGVVQGRIVEVGTVANEANSGEGEKSAGSSGESNGESATIPVTLVVTRRVPHLDEAPVSVELVKSVRRNVLAVPATALFATAGNRYAIEVLERSRRVQVPVTPGMFANGYVQVEGGGLREGQRVIESE